MSRGEDCTKLTICVGSTRCSWVVNDDIVTPGETERDVTIPDYGAIELVDESVEH